jgi:MYXO-CTERM domain-containing protein
LIDWLRAEDYRVTEPMEPYIELYTSEGMKFLALKLLETADVKDLKPFRFSMPGSVPSIPLRMTSLAAEPEMSVVVFILGDQRYEAKNWQNVTIDESGLRYDPNTWPALTNWPILVAKGVDEAGGQGWVTEFAGSTESFVTQIQAQIEADTFNAEEDREAAHALLEVLEPHPYLTRLYSRLSAEEMTSDPIFGRSAGADVDQVHDIQAAMDGTDVCAVPTDPCDFVTCGAGGICRTAVVDDGNGGEQSVTGCGCVVGATARTTFAPDGSATVICQDQRMSFLNAGDQEAGTEILPDGCAEFDCGEHGTCVPVNMTPTCVCDQGYIAVGNFTEEGQRRTTCVAPSEAIEASFYDRRLPALPANMPGGRDDVMMPSGGSGGGSTIPTNSTSSGGTAAEPADPDPPANMADAGAKSSGGGCSTGATSQRPAPLVALGVLAAGLAFTRRQRKSA